MLGEFEIVDLVGEGGFGIVYLAQDHSLHRKVALKEYMPALLASRGRDASVSVRSERQRETFDIACAASSTRRGCSPSSTIRH